LAALPALPTAFYGVVGDAGVSGAGLAPYAYGRAGPEVGGLRDPSISPRLNHSTWQTVSPPVTQAFFRAVYRLAPDSVLAMKLALGLAELLALASLAFLLRTLDLPLGRPPIYPWNPLPPVA